MLPALIPVALSLAPQLGRWLFGSTGEEVTTAVVDVARAVTGLDNPNDAAAMIKADPALAAQMQIRLAEIAAHREEAAAKAQTETLSALVASGAQQTDVNKAEAANENVFVAGWRPFVGWVCGAGIAYAFVISPLLAFSLGKPPVKIETSELMLLIQGMLGFAGLRTWEKYKLGKA